MNEMACDDNSRSFATLHFFFYDDKVKVYCQQTKPTDLRRKHKLPDMSKDFCLQAFSILMAFGTALSVYSWILKLYEILIQ